MKQIRFHLLILAIGMLTLNSCEDYYGDINVDPDNPTAVTPNVLLPQIQVRLAYGYWGDASRFLGIYTQHLDGATRQFAVIQNYGILPTDLDNLWGQNLYSGVLMDNRQLAAIAEENGYNHFLAISKAMEAYTMMLVADWWGDAPYSEAFRGTELLQPKFDTQESIYDAIFNLINEARNLLEMEPGGFAPNASSDFFYGGDPEQWQKFLNVLEARGRLHLADADPANYQLALDALNKGGFESPADDARLMFGNGPTESAPWYQYIEQRDDIEIGDTYVQLLREMDDPRRYTYGLPLDVSDDPSSYTHPVLTRNRDVPLLTFVEQQFIEAEALFQTQGAAAAYDAYLEGVEASLEESAGYFDNLNVDSLNFTGNEPPVATADLDYQMLVDDYLQSGEVAVGAANLTLEDIIIQKYIALFLDPEVFSDWRRTDIPDLEPNAGNQVPRRLPYSQNEILSNSNTPSPATVDIYTPVGWDE